MVRSMLVAALAATTATALSIGRREASGEELFTIELEPGVVQVVTEEQKWALKNEGKTFIDITNHPNLASSASAKGFSKAAAAVAYPAVLVQQDTVNGLISLLDRSFLEDKLKTFSDFYNRYYRSTYGKESSDWLLGQVQAVVDASGVPGITVRAVTHSWIQNSIIATIPGKSTDKVVVGAHLDSVNGRNRAGRSPGADDDGSGSITILEALRVLLTDPTIAAGEAVNTLEFQWYAGEEAGLLGSADIFDAYASSGTVVKAMLQQDMTGYANGPLGVINDYVDSDLTAFVREVINTYTTVGYVDTQCGYGCSDHASASAAGYPSSFVIEASMDRISPYIHTDGDTIDTISFDHVLEHARLVLGYAYELALADL
ncbi:Zn-dependent exopeptidase [Durotheca rogersii]|uniref:Zn-dependent exopeptidase n=1 Tax=Durotheca rogersii TaxID=419775 RepID=UPI0022208793|nr:Zn-dependent exopeptidase [Durotheca rogersii]KAI5854069.1 Zn-dependent exopeptidase [Durotheca rogersii]